MVHKVKYSSQAKGNEGKWFFTDYKSDANKTIFFTKHQNEADLKIYFTEYASEAKWLKNSKKHLMY
ncbi:MAG: DUF6150 family protein [Flavobacteriales bacterium]|nr:DUF6150 family protein [Flavobacteriales bacterium]